DPRLHAYLAKKQRARRAVSTGANGAPGPAHQHEGDQSLGAALSHDDHMGRRAIDAQPGAAASDVEWVHYLSDLYRFLRDQTGAEKEALLDIRANRNAHPIVGAVSETFAAIRAGFHSVKAPDPAIWDQVSQQLERAHALF